MANLNLPYPDQIDRALPANLRVNWLSTKLLIAFASSCDPAIAFTPFSFDIEPFVCDDKPKMGGVLLNSVTRCSLGYNWLCVYTFVHLSYGLSRDV
eukprot:6052224-Pleurochrysis_carterae.AAC.1